MNMVELEKRDTGRKRNRWTNSHEDITNMCSLYTVTAANNRVKGRKLNFLMHLLFVLFGASGFGQAELRQAAEDKLQSLLQKQHQRTFLLLFG